MAAIMESDSETITFEFYSKKQSSLYQIEFDARIDLDSDNKFGNILDNFYCMTLVKSSSMISSEMHESINVNTECDEVASEIAAIIDRFYSEEPSACVFFIIDKEDNKDKARERLFSKWYDMNGNKSNYFYEVYPIENVTVGEEDRIGVIIPQSKNLDIILDAFLLSFTF